MQEYVSTVLWQRGSQAFTDQRYSRVHAWMFDGGLQVPASPSPMSVAPPMSDPAALDPEEAFVAAVSSCHMLFFLHIASQRGIVIDEYRDHAVGVLEKDAAGKMSMTKITLRPAIAFSGPLVPDHAALAAIHHAAHDKCYLANSIKTEVVVEGID